MRCSSTWYMLIRPKGPAASSIVATGQPIPYRALRSCCVTDLARYGLPPVLPGTKTAAGDVVIGLASRPARTPTAIR